MELAFDMWYLFRDPVLYFEVTQMDHK